MRSLLLILALAGLVTVLLAEEASACLFRRLRPSTTVVYYYPVQEKKALEHKAAVHIYPHKLTPKDKLSDGKDGRPIAIRSETTLIWVDLAPDARFAHATEYVLISAEGTRVVKGQWWPVLNGNDLFRDGKKTMLESPIDLPGK